MRRVVVPAVLVLLGGLLAGCSADSGSSSDSADSSQVRSGQQIAGQAEGGVDAAQADGAVTDRQVVSTGTVGIVVADPTAAAQRAVELVEAAGGRIDNRVEQAATEDQAPSAHLVVRIPSERLSATIEQLKDLGAVERVELTATDVTDKVQDLDARITALTVSVTRLEALMGKATTNADLVALESALSTRQSDLEAMQAQQAGLAGQVALATITLDLVPRPTVLARSPHGFWSGLGTGWNALVTTLGGLLIAVGVLLPWVVFCGLLAVAAIAVIRFVRARRPAAPVPPAAPTVADLLGGGSGPL